MLDSSIPEQPNLLSHLLLLLLQIGQRLSLKFLELLFLLQPPLHDFLVVPAELLESTSQKFAPNHADPRAQFLLLIQIVQSLFILILICLRRLLLALLSLQSRSLAFLVCVLLASQLLRNDPLIVALDHVSVSLLQTELIQDQLLDDFLAAGLMRAYFSLDHAAGNITDFRFKIWPRPYSASRF